MESPSNVNMTDANMTVEEYHKKEVFKDALKACKEIVKISNNKLKQISPIDYERHDIPEKKSVNHFKISTSKPKARLTSTQGIFERKSSVGILNTIKKKRLTIMDRKKLSPKHESIKNMKKNDVMNAKGLTQKSPKENGDHDMIKYYSSYKQLDRAY